MTLTQLVLLAILALLILLASFFSGAETGLMALNRYRLKHLAKQQHRAAIRAQRLLAQPEKFLGVVLIGNTCANIIASAIATTLAAHWFGELGIAIVTGLLTLIILIFAEIAPKTLAAHYPERFAFPATLPLKFLLAILCPLVWLLNQIVNGILKTCGFKLKPAGTNEQVSAEELKTILHEAGDKIPSSHQNMLLSILELEAATVEDIMIPRPDIVGINIADSWDSALELLTNSQYTRLPVYDEDINNLKGVLHVRKVILTMAQASLSLPDLLAATQQPYFIPEGTPLHIQLINFRENKERTGFVVDEYGDILGLVTLEDILEEIVGEFTTDVAATHPEIYPQADGSYLVNGSITLRDLNRIMDWSFNTDGPKTLSGLIIEHLEAIPQPGIALKLGNYPVEIIQVQGNMVKTAKILPAV